MLNSQRVKILLVDDRPENIFSLSSLLSDINVEIVPARSGQEALQLLLEHDVALALLDVQMPGMDGFELAELMRGVDRTKNVPIIFLTAAAHRTNFEFKGYEKGAVDFLFKPVDAHILRSKVKVFIRLAEATSLLEQKVREAEVARAEADSARVAAERADQSKSSFLANMSHEIRTPIGALMGFAELLKLPGLSSELRDSYIEILLKNSRHLLALINEILDLSKVEAGHLEVDIQSLRLREAMDEVVLLLNAMAMKNRVELELEIADDVPEEIGTDPLRFRQVVTNVVGNAIKFSPGGSVKVVVEYPDSESAQQLWVTVHDTGMGISQDKMPHLFKAFSQGDASVTKKFGGTGLGLVLSRHLAKLLGGDIQLLKSEVDKGSTFRIVIEDKIRPLHAKKTVPARAEVDDKKADLSGMNILAVDDSDDNQLLIKTVLERYGARVQLASDGLEGIDCALANRFDIILMDYQMPRCDGLQATRRLRDQGLRTPIVALTANAMKDERERALDAGCDDYHSKPIQWEGLVRTIRRLT